MNWPDPLKPALLFLLATTIVSPLGGGERANPSGQPLWRVATEPTYPPFVYWDGHQVEGFEAALIKEIAKNSGCQVAFTTAPLDSLLPSLEKGYFQLIIGGMSKSASRAKRFDFSDPVCRNGVAIFSKKRIDIETLGVKPIALGTQRGSLFVEKLAASYGDKISFRVYDSMEQAITDLAAGRVAGVVADESVLISKQQQTKYKNYHLARLTKIPPTEICFVVKKGDKELLDRLNKGLERLKREGRYQEIKEQTFSAIQPTKAQFLLPILQGIGKSLWLSLLALCLGLLLSLLLYALISSKYRLVRYLVKGYVALVKGLPEIFVLTGIFYYSRWLSKSLFGSYPSSLPFWVSLIALSLLFASYAATTWVAAFSRVDSGLLEAGQVMGLSSSAIFLHIQLPQAVGYALPALYNLFLVLVKDTALAALIGTYELMNCTRMAAIATEELFYFYGLATLSYFLITFMLRHIFNQITRCYIQPT